jgi:hypothetical protein
MLGNMLSREIRHFCAWAKLMKLVESLFVALARAETREGKS